MVVSKLAPSLPIIDLAPIRNPNASDADWATLGNAICDACRHTGFVYLVNSGIEEAEVDKWFEASKRLFALDVEDKKRFERPEGIPTYRGWAKSGTERINLVTPLFYNKEELVRLGKLGEEKKESFQLGEKGTAPNIWPPEETLPGFRATAESAMNKVLTVRNQMFKVLASGIPGYPLKQFEEMHTKNDLQMRFAHYLSVPWNEVEKRDAAWLSPHADWTTFTFVFQHKISGLEVEDPAQRLHFIPIEPIPGAIVFNIGDCLQRLTNDQFKSNVHRVVPVQPKTGAQTEERYSLTFFVSPNQDAILESLPGTCDDSNKNKYPSIVMSDWVSERMTKTVN